MRGIQKAPYAKQHFDEATPLPSVTAEQIRKAAIPHAVQTQLLEKFGVDGAAANYFKALPWEMMPDLATIRNADMSLGFLSLPHFRTHGHALGSSISKRCCKDREANEFCPSCNRKLSDTPSHALFDCAAPGLRKARADTLPELQDYMKRNVPEWTLLYEDASSSSERTQLVLMAACFATADHITPVMKLVTDWLGKVQAAHPAYSKYLFTLGIETVDYY